MTTIMPEGDAIRNAVQWISEKRQTDPKSSIQKLMDEAGLKFNLSPREQEFLSRFCREQG
ncbi:MAG: hypothetical protein KKA41_02035 [Proteobacteria bacterium]|nr:hypothetical protein [Pseudomonadota bacterium]MBU4053121.1 hypothetical protein [Pseudomonadota bacterium]